MTLRIVVFDYGAGNLHSLVKALAAPATEVSVERDLRRAVAGDMLVLPGVGAFATATDALGDGRRLVRDAIRDGLPTLGICLGMQLLFDRSAEGGGAGLGVVAGEVTRLEAPRLPQIGWNVLDGIRDPLIAGSALRDVYYANSYACRPSDPGLVTAWTSHGADRFPAAVRAGRTIGVQFHPEKSSAPGGAFLHAFIEQARRWRRGTETS